MVYSATFDPFGGIQKTWISTYAPALKYSSKEREPSTEMDYFGARYYDHLKYRFLTPDPVLGREEAIGNPQLWNLYAYCGNKSITLQDLDGRKIFYENADLRLLFESLAVRSKMVRETMAFYNDESDPNLAVRHVDAGYDIDGTEAGGAFNIDYAVDYSGKESFIKPGMTVDQIEDLGVWRITGATLAIDKSLTISLHNIRTVESALHEIGHADQAARTPLIYKRQSAMVRNADRTLIEHDERLVEQYANEYRVRALKEVR